MYKHNLIDLIEYNDKKPHPTVLMNRPGYRLMLISLRSGQEIPEHATKEMVTVYAISGRITFSTAQLDCELRAGEVLSIDGGASHRLEAHADSALLVLAAGGAYSPVDNLLDLREIPRAQRHSLVFAKFDALAVAEFFVLINDHDPVPLSRQMVTMRPGQAAWEYIERGPANFRIRVRRIATADGPGNTPSALSAGLLQEIRGT